MASAKGLWGLVGLVFPAVVVPPLMSLPVDGGLFFVPRFFMASIPARPRRTRRVALCSCLRSTSSKVCSPCRTFPCLTMFRRDIRLSFFLTVVSAEAITLIEGENGPATLKTLSGEEAIRYTNRLRGDDEFAAREQARARRKADANGEGVKPAYCDSRYYKILAGGNGQGGVGCS